MLLKIIALAISLLGLSEVENIIHTKVGSTEKVVILCPNGTITIERRPEPITATNGFTNLFSPRVITNWSPGSPVPTIPIPLYQGGFTPTPNTVTTNFQP